ncbi:uncharacterized protein PAC_09908 [Phialocephala subalpina]|uniref:Uncharacterized protein n=1 Tax=Phialocephala subalpina TaxID=576137 RepID=A0A1L7X4R1_9HELO|nr:uncharacterized protein PAC_09908 [Phialocephala subalpina]
MESRYSKGERPIMMMSLGELQTAWKRDFESEGVDASEDEGYTVISERGSRKEEEDGHRDNEGYQAINDASGGLSTDLECQCSGAVPPSAKFSRVDQRIVLQPGAQVKLMGEIYSRVARAAAYLGESHVAPKDKDENSALTLMNTLLRIWDHDQEHTLRSENDWSALQMPESAGGLSGNAWMEMLKLWSQPWFSCAWVLQEVILAKVVAVFYGPAVSSLENIMQFWHLARIHDVPRSLKYGSVADLVALVRNSNRLGTFKRLRDVREGTYAAAPQKKKGKESHRSSGGSGSGSQTKTSSKRSNIKSAAPIESIASERVYKSVAELYISRGFAIDVLHHAGLPQLIESLPTWVPDWNRWSNFPFTTLLYDGTPSAVPRIVLSDAASSLTTRGAIIDIFIVPSMSWSFETVMQDVRRGRRIGITACRQVSVFPGGTRQGDLIVFLLGATMPFVLRRSGYNEFTLIGDCYLHGVMERELIRPDTEGEHWVRLEDWYTETNIDGEPFSVRLRPSANLFGLMTDGMKAALQKIPVSTTHHHPPHTPTRKAGIKAGSTGRGIGRGAGSIGMRAVSIDRCCSIDCGVLAYEGSGKKVQLASSQGGVTLSFIDVSVYEGVNLGEKIVISGLEVHKELFHHEFGVLESSLQDEDAAKSTDALAGVHFTPRVPRPQLVAPHFSPGCRTNPTSRLSYGYGIYQDGKQLATGCGSINNLSHIFDAKAIGAYKGLEHATQLGPAVSGRRLWLCIDNTSVIWCIRGNASTFSQWAFLNIQGVMETHNIRVRWAPGHTVIEGNEAADKLADQGALKPQWNNGLASEPTLTSIRSIMWKLRNQARAE